MSHVTKIKLSITDLDALEAALNTLGGFELRRGQTTFTNYQGKGKCDHAIVQSKQLALNYEIGLKAVGDGSYELLWDSFDSRLAQSVGGREATKLKQEYAAAVALKQFYSQGYQVTRSVTTGGRVVLEATR